MWRDTKVSQMQGGTVIRYQGADYLIARMLWVGSKRRELKLEPLAGGPAIEREFFNWSIYPTRSNECRTNTARIP